MSPCPGRRDSRPSPLDSFDSIDSIDSVESIEKTEQALGGPRAIRGRLARRAALYPTLWSGNPPCGQLDLVPIESPADNLANYRCLLMLGWNTMTAENYEKLREWVAAGGRLIVAVPHMRSDIARSPEIGLFNGGDLSSLCGVKVHGPSGVSTCGVRFLHDPDLEGYSLPTFNNFQRFSDPVCIDGPIPLAEVELAGARVLACRSNGADALPEYPVLVEHKVGRGTTLLLTTWCYPGKREMKSLMLSLINAVIRGEQYGPRVVGSDRIRFSFYREGNGYRGYFLNTDFDLAAHCRITLDEKQWELTIPPTEMQVLHIE